MLQRTLLNLWMTSFLMNSSNYSLPLPAFVKELNCWWEQSWKHASKSAWKVLLNLSFLSTAYITTKFEILEKKHAKDELFIVANGLEIGETDSVLKEALDIQFKNSRSGWHFTTNTLFKTSGPTVNKISDKKNKFNIHYFCCFMHVLLLQILID